MVDLRNICCRFERGTALDNINFRAERGEYIAVLGESGSGKSVLADILCGRRKPDGGEYFFNGYRVRFDGHNGKYGGLRGRVQLISRHSEFLDGLSAKENIKLALTAAGFDRRGCERTATELLDAAGIADLKDRSPDTMSRGQRYRLALARAIAGPCEMLIADEPTENADQNYAEELLNGFSDLQKKEKTVIIMTANAQVAVNAPRVLCLSAGRII